MMIGIVLLAVLSGSVLVKTSPGLTENLQTSDGGTLKFTCDIKNGVPEDGVACRVTIDSVPQAPDVAAGATQEYPVAAGDRNVLVEIVGTNAALFDPANVQKTVSVTAGKTATLKATFTKKGHLFLTTDKGLPADFYVDGAVVATQVVSTDLWVAPGKHQILVNAIADPAAGPAYVWKDGTASATVGSGKDKTVTIKLKQAFTKGFVNIICAITSGAANAVCIPTIDGVAQSPIAPGATQQFLLDKGKHVVVVDLGPANVFEPEQLTKKFNLQLGKTVDIPVTFNAGPPVFRITVINKTSQPLCYVYIVPVGTPIIGGTNHLTNGAKIKVGAKATFEFQAGTYNLYTEDCSFGTYPMQLNIALGPGIATAYEWTVTKPQLPGGPTKTLTLENRSNMSICVLIIAPLNSTDPVWLTWNLISFNKPFFYGEDRDFKLPSNTYDFSAADCSGQVAWEETLYLYANTRITLFYLGG
jgi:hypothetical protein